MDSIGDLLSQINNAYLVGKKKCSVPFSRQRSALVDFLVKHGYLKDFKERADGQKKKKLVISLKYHQGEPPLRRIKRVSKPGRRFYSSATNIPWTQGGLGITVVSTPSGLMSGKEARKENLGGEIICQIFS